MKRTFLFLVTCLVALGGLVAPAQARVVTNEVKILVNGLPFHGEWAFVGERPYVGIESFGKALACPRRHNVLHWCLEPTKPAGTCDASPFELAVRSRGKALPTVRHGGNTMVDLRQALQVLGIPFQFRMHDRTLVVGNPYFGEAMKGERYRRSAVHHDYYGNRTSLWPPGR